MVSFDNVEHALPAIVLRLYMFSFSAAVAIIYFQRQYELEPISMSATLQPFLNSWLRDNRFSKLQEYVRQFAPEHDAHH